MRFAKWKSGSLILAPALVIASSLFGTLAVSFIPLKSVAQDSRPADLPPPTDAKYLQLEHHPSSQIAAADQPLIRTRQREINAEATFFGYDLNAGEWDYDETSCPAIPDQLILHYRRQFSGGAQSLFTALVPRGARSSRLCSGRWS